MKRCLAIFGFVFIGVIAGLIVRGIPIVLQVNAGGGIQADRNGDVNGDARLDMSDAVYLLLHIFRDGPQPVAFAQAEPADLRGLEGSMNRIADSLDSLVVLEQERGDPLTRIADAIEEPAPGGCEQSEDRFTWQRENRTVIDTCKNLMWADHNMQFDVFRDLENPDDLLSGFRYAGYSDWRLPTIDELSSLLVDDSLRFSNDYVTRPFIFEDEWSHVFTNFKIDRNTWVLFNFTSSSGSLYRYNCNCDSASWVDQFSVLPVRDIGPGE